MKQDLATACSWTHLNCAHLLSALQGPPGHDGTQGAQGDRGPPVSNGRISSLTT